MPEPMIVVELFCGTKSIGNTFATAGHKVFTIDYDPSFNPDLAIDILKFDVSMLPPEFQHPDVVWASPPCTTFSVASMGHHWTGGKGAYIPRTEEAKIGLELMKKTVGLIDQLRPVAWFIENPRGLMRKLIGLPLDMRHTVCYCRYGDTRMKPTDIWSNTNLWDPKPMCHNGNPDHEAAPRGAKTGTQGLKGAKERSRIPEALCKDIVRGSTELVELNRIFKTQREGVK